MGETRKERFEKALLMAKQEGKFKTQQELAEMMNSNKATVSAAKNGDETYLTDNFLARFNAAVGYMFNLEWLIRGVGDVMGSAADVSSGVYTVPAIPLSAAGGSLRDISCEGVIPYETVVSPVNNADFAIGVYGDSMAPTYPSGSRVFIRKIDHNSFISWGSVFVLDTINGIYIKEVQRGHNEEYIRCVSHNQSGRYPDFEMPIRDIFGMYRVIACVSVTQ